MYVRPKPSVALTRSSPFGAARLLDTSSLQLFDVRENPPRIRQIDLAFVGEAQAARRAVEQPHPKPLFQLCESLADGGRGDVQLARGSRETAFLDHQGEEGQFRGLTHC